MPNGRESSYSCQQFGHQQFSFATFLGIFDPPPPPRLYSFDHKNNFNSLQQVEVSSKLVLTMLHSHPGLILRYPHGHGMHDATCTT